MMSNSSNDKVHITLSPVPDNEMISHSFNDEVHTAPSVTIFENSSNVSLPIVTVTSLEEANSKLQNALLQSEQAKEEIERIKIRAKQTEIKLKKANAIILKLDKSKTLLKRNARKLMDENKKLAQKIRILQTSKNIDIRKILNDDQVTALNEQNPRSLKWSNNTIIKALRLKMSCGSTGYTELLNQNIPLPSERTLRRKLENIKFETGVCNDIFDILQQVLQFTDNRERDCVLVMDEMSIAAGEQVDPSTKCSFGLSTLPDKHGGLIPIEIAAYVSACVFNEGSKALLQIMQAMGLSTGPNAHAFVADEDEGRVAIAERRAQENTQEARKHRRQKKIDALEVASAAEGLLYGPEIDDSV
ncbi:PREDICTED: uncharacterized protein LOC108783587 [Cyphomyrmex costatus]|uniref:uncharacterized protein LOC108783587 n=1 Tax=Cyphomyrmex costatus TaxID=456900 RepID=UPI0008523371|nr:PREDICTED: uncharacterized protein LOC108783587 [Cyphomyrmex costatus]XP_018407690.1 PREDICTED: uncharacterized protein LOC108783587 [Cyphomyrmex costatus]